MRRDAEGLLERSREVGFGDSAHARQPPDGPFLVRGGVHPVLRAQQAAQQLRVLACLTSGPFHRSTTLIVICRNVILTTTVRASPPQPFRALSPWTSPARR